MTKITNFVWNSVDDCIISELDGTGAVQAIYTNEPRQYGGVISQRRGTTTSTYHYDALGSTRFLTDSSGNVTDTYLHDAWGNSIASTGSTVNPFRWGGRFGYFHDVMTGISYIRDRIYLPRVARWSASDPAIFVDGPNWYIYCNNSPEHSIDPSGKSLETSCGLDCGGKSIGTLIAIGVIPLRDYSKPRLGGTLEFSAFINNSPPCCCESIQYIQVVRINFAQPEFVPPENKPIFIDGKKRPQNPSSPPFYPDHRGPADRDAMVDSPFATLDDLEQTFGLTFQNPLVREFETCAVCVKQRSEFENDYTVLQCMKWAMVYTRHSTKTKPGFEWTLEWELPSCSGLPSSDFNEQISQWPHLPNGGVILE